MKGLSSANWIIKKIETFARSTANPYTPEELAMLTKSIDYFNESNRDQFLKLNEKTVRMIREAIVDEKLAGAECIEARDGLFIPPQWQIAYLDVYDNNLPWLISHCAQNAMLHDPTQGETKNWVSPRIISGSRDSKLKKAEQDEVLQVSSDIEFGLLNASIRTFLAGTDYLLAARTMLAMSLQREHPDQESNRFRSRIELLNIFNSIGNLDDDTTSAWSLFVLDEQIHEPEKAKRDLLREKTRYGAGTVMSKNQLKSKGLIEVNFCRKPSPFFTDVIVPFDFMCKTIGIEAIFAKLHAYNSVQLAIAIAKSTVFSSDQEIAMNEVFAYASVLAEQVRILDSYDADSESFEDLHGELLAISSRSSGMVDLLTILNFGPEIEGTFLDEWRDSFSNVMLGFLAESEIELDGDSVQIEKEDFSESRYVLDESIRDSASRLSAAEDLFNKGLITADEYENKRKQIIDQI